MRISTSQIFTTAVNAILDQQSDVNKTQLQLATGRRILTPSDDPAAAARALDIQQALDTTAQYQKNADVALARQGLEENAMVGVGNILQRIRELAIQGNNDSNSDADRDSIAVEVRQRLDELVALANTRDSNQEYIFAGYQGFTTPFTKAPSGAISYNGDAGQRFVQIDTNRQIAIGDSGIDVFLAIRNGNGVFSTQDNLANSGDGVIDPGVVDGSFVPDTYTISFTQLLPTDPITYEVTGVTSGVVVPAGTNYVDGADIVFNGVRTKIEGTPANGDSFSISPSVDQDLFTTVENLALALEQGGGSATADAQFHNAMNRFMVDVDQGLENILNIRAKIGARLNVIDNQQNLNEDNILQLEQTLSDLQDLDYAEAASRLNLQLVGLEAAQQTFIRVQGLSLFNFL